MNSFSREDDPERQPLRPSRQDSRAENRQRFEENQAAEAQAIFSTGMCCIVGTAVAMGVFIAVWTVFYFMGLSIWVEHNDRPCDQPLASWLLIMLLFPLLSSFLGYFDCKTLQWAMVLLTSCALIAGVYIFFQSETCAETNPELYIFVKQYLIFLSAWFIFRELTTCVVVGVLVYGMMNGWFDDINGASPDAIHLLETVAYDPALFAQEGIANDSRPAPECCICTATFDSTEAIKRTPCHHYFHEECLKKWLKAARTCPLCRYDLDKSLSSDRSDASTSGKNESTTLNTALRTLEREEEEERTRLLSTAANSGPQNLQA